MGCFKNISVEFFEIVKTIRKFDRKQSYFICLVCCLLLAFLPGFEQIINLVLNKEGQGYNYRIPGHTRLGLG